MRVRVFIQNEAGSNVKNYHDEKALTWERSVQVSRPYPFPYGFIIGTTSPDGLNADCFVITKRRLHSGDVVRCEALGLMEQIEDGEEDHNVLAGLEDEVAAVTPPVEAELTEFVRHVFDHVAGKTISVGRFLGPERARAHIATLLDHV